jgi:hypothetical protein
MEEEREEERVAEGGEKERERGVGKERMGEGGRECVEMGG